MIKIYFNSAEGKIGYDNNGTFVPIVFSSNNTFRLPKRIRISVEPTLGKITKLSEDDRKNFIYQFYPSEEFQNIQAKAASELSAPAPPEVLIKFTLVYISDRGWFLQSESNKFYPFEFPKPRTIVSAAAGGGGGGISGIDIEDDGTLIVQKAKTLNFIGELVSVLDAGAKQANITVKIPSMTTAQREALIPTTALIVEDTDLDMYYKWSTVSSSWIPF